MTDKKPSDGERYTASPEREIPTPGIEDQQGIETLPEDVLYDEGCPRTDNPNDSAHNTHKARKVLVRDGELVLLLFMRCSCGYENRNVIS